MHPHLLTHRVTLRRAERAAGRVGRVGVCCLVSQLAERTMLHMHRQQVQRCRDEGQLGLWGHGCVRVYMGGWHLRAQCTAGWVARVLHSAVLSSSQVRMSPVLIRRSECTSLGCATIDLECIFAMIGDVAVSVWCGRTVTHVLLLIVWLVPAAVCRAWWPDRCGSHSGPHTHTR